MYLTTGMVWELHTEKHYLYNVKCCSINRSILGKKHELNIDIPRVFISLVIQINANMYNSTSTTLITNTNDTTEVRYCVVLFHLKKTLFWENQKICCCVYATIASWIFVCTGMHSFIYNTYTCIVIWSGESWLPIYE